MVTIGIATVFENVTHIGCRSKVTHPVSPVEAERRLSRFAG